VQNKEKTKKKHIAQSKQGNWGSFSKIKDSQQEESSGSGNTSHPIMAPKALVIEVN
jgi:hypothetical protein